MEQPPGGKVLDENGELAVCELDKAIYGLPEAAAAWYNRLKDYLDTIEIQSVEDDTCVFVGYLGGHRIVLIIYVDDGIIGASEAGKEEFMASFGKEFEVEEKGPLDGQTFVGIEIKYDREAGRMELRQEGHTLKILERAEMLESKPTSTPVQVGIKHYAQEKDQPAVHQHDYLVLVGMLQWLTHMRPDITYGVNLAARWSHNPGKEQWAHLRHLLRYINGTRKAGLSFGANELEEPLRIITDADFAGCLDTRRSTLGVICQVFGSTVSHISRRQTQSSGVSEGAGGKASQT